jgi:hypothetical protein
MKSWRAYSARRGVDGVVAAHADFAAAAAVDGVLGQAVDVGLRHVGHGHRHLDARGGGADFFGEPAASHAAAVGAIGTVEPGRAGPDSAAAVLELL